MTVALTDLQELFWASMRGATVDAASIDQTFCGTGSLPAVQRIRIYRGMYWARQLAAILQDFPGVAVAVGGEMEFRSLAHEYLLVFPSQDPRLEYLGQRLPGFLRRHANAAWAACADLAAFEWAQVAAFVAPDPRAVVARWELTVDDAARARLTFVPSLQLLQLESDPNGRATPNAARVRPSSPSSAVRIAVWRRDFHVFSVGLTPEELTAAHAAREGATMAEICCAFSDLTDAEVRAASVIAGWLSRGWVSRVIPGAGS